MKQFKTSEFRSIGNFLNSDGTVTLTPIKRGDQMPLKIVVTQKEFREVKSNKENMMTLAVKKLNEQKT